MGKLLEFLLDFPHNVVPTERLNLLREQVQAIEQKCVDLEAENSRLAEENANFCGNFRGRDGDAASIDKLG